jgi:hypothetical protein
METFPESHLTHLSWSPVKEPSFQVPSWSSLGEKCPVPRAPFIHLSKSLVDEPSSRFPSGALLWKEMLVSSAILSISFRVPSKGAPLQVPLTELP